MNTLEDGPISQVLLKLGEMGTDIAVIKEKMTVISDHEFRIRSLERWKYSLPIALLFAIGSVAASILSLLQK